MPTDHPDSVVLLTSVAVHAMLDTLKECAKSLDQLVEFASAGPFPAESLKRAINLVQTKMNTRPEKELSSEMIDMLICMGTLCDKLGSMPEVVAYHERAKICHAAWIPKPQSQSHNN